MRLNGVRGFALSAAVAAAIASPVLAGEEDYDLEEVSPAAAADEEDVYSLDEAVINSRLDANYRVALYDSYPMSFYGRRFVSKTNGAQAIAVFAVLPSDGPESLAPNVIIRDYVARHFGCPDAKIPDGPKDEIYEYEEFSNCRIDGREVKGEVYQTGFFYNFVLRDDSISQKDAQLMSLYDRNFQMGLCAQDCNAIGDSVGFLAPEIRNRGYGILPSFATPVPAQAYVFPTFIRQKDNSLYSWAVFAARSAADFSRGIKDFCGGSVKLNKTDRGYSFTDCVSSQYVNKIKVSGRFEIRKDLAVLTIHSDAMAKDERKMFEDQLENALKNFKPENYEL
ncbi:MAG: hypothetical protein IJ523_02160 [Succinivibrionaceae bacterium]|nr:hypothetical protein [Succinivibrionaceae bacterium]